MTKKIAKGAKKLAQGGKRIYKSFSDTGKKAYKRLDAKRTIDVKKSIVPKKKY